MSKINRTDGLTIFTARNKIIDYFSKAKFTDTADLIKYLSDITKIYVGYYKEIKELDNYLSSLMDTPFAVAVIDNGTIIREINKLIGNNIQIALFITEIFENL